MNPVPWRMIREYFKGGRRKTACVLMCLPLVVWMRSYQFLDRIGLYWGQGHYDFTSECGSIALTCAGTGSQDLHHDTWSWRSYDAKRLRNYDGMLKYYQRLLKRHGQWKFRGFLVDTHVRIFPFWSIAIPSTFLFACLLLWPKRRKVKKPAAET